MLSDHVFRWQLQYGAVLHVVTAAFAFAAVSVSAAAVAASYAVSTAVSAAALVV